MSKIFSVLKQYAVRMPYAFVYSEVGSPSSWSSGRDKFTVQCWTSRCLVQTVNPRECNWLWTVVSPTAGNYSVHESEAWPISSKRRTSRISRRWVHGAQMKCKDTCLRTIMIIFFTSTIYFLFSSKVNIMIKWHVSMFCRWWGWCWKGSNNSWNNLRKLLTG